MSKKLLIANWKMEFTINQILEYLTLSDWQDCASALTEISLVLCPSFESLITVKEFIKNENLPISLGAQDCSSENLGPHTGQVSSKSLKEIGVSYCLIGHSETRTSYHLTEQAVFEKIIKTFEHEIIPIVCIGEKHLEKNSSKVIESITEQINTIQRIADTQYASKKMLVAYEPAWAIGTEKFPERESLLKIITLLRETLKPHQEILYGGSIDEETLTSLTKIEDISGYLVGKASCDIKRLKKMIYLLHDIELKNKKERK